MSLKFDVFTIADAELFAIDPYPNESKCCPPGNQKSTESYECWSQGWWILEVRGDARRRLAGGNFG